MLADSGRTQRRCLGGKRTVMATPLLYADFIAKPACRQGATALIREFYDLKHRYWD